MRVGVKVIGSYRDTWDRTNSELVFGIDGYLGRGWGDGR